MYYSASQYASSHTKDIYHLILNWIRNPWHFF